MYLLPIKFSDEDFQKIMDLAACNYSADKIAAQLGVDKSAFMQLFSDQESDVYQAYDAGRMKAQFNIMNKQRELAETGNITAAQVFLKESKAIEIANIRNKCLFGDDH